jgi:nucleolar GTP-binding protein
MSIKYNKGIDTVLTTTVDAAEWKPDIPPSRQA